MSSAQLPYDKVRKSHLTEYQQYFNRISFSLGEQRVDKQDLRERLEHLQDGKQDLELIALLFHFGRYLLIASSRPKTRAATSPENEFISQGEKAARQSLWIRGDEGTGWSLAWKILMWAGLKDGNHAWKIIRNLFRLVEPQKPSHGGLYANLFCAHPPFQIDGNFGYVAGVVWMFPPTGSYIFHRSRGSKDNFPRLESMF